MGRRRANRQSSPARASLRAWVAAHPADVVDVFVYVVVLNLAVEYLPEVISETFTWSLVTALLLKVALEVVLRLKNLVLSRFRAAGTRRARTLFALLLWTVAAGSKLVVAAQPRACARGDQWRFAPYATTYLSLFVFRNGFEYLRYGHAAAATVVVLGLTMLVVVLQWRLLKRMRSTYPL